MPEPNPIKSTILEILQAIRYLGWLPVFALSIWFRFLSYWIARHWRGLLSAAILSPLAILLVRAPGRAMDLLRDASNHVSVGRLFQGLAVLALINILVWAFRARNSTYIGAFEDYTGDAALKDAVRGVAPLLENQLGKIRLLYATSDDSGALTAESVFRTINVQNVGESLKTIVTGASTVKLGPLEMPIGATLGLLAEIAKGPRLFGSVHQQDGKLLVIAGLEGGRFPRFDWKVGIDDLDAPEEGCARPVLERMIEQLASRVFTDLGEVGSPSWRAVDSFSRGLEPLRKTSRTDVAKAVNLRKAERAFIQALSHDSKFWRCHYNLGVAYKSLGHHDAARVAFRKTIEGNPAFPDAYYALGSLAWPPPEPKDETEESKAHLREVVHFCDQAIALNPRHALAWTSKGYAQRRLSGGDTGRLIGALQCQEKASAIAWGHVCRLTWARRPAERARSEAKLCLQNLAACHSYLPAVQLSVAVFRQALYLAPGDTDLWFELGNAHLKCGNCPAAAQAYTIAAQGSGKPLHWACLAEAEVEIHKGAAAVLEACGKARDSAYLDPFVVTKIAELYEKAGKPELKQEIERIVKARELGDRVLTLAMQNPDNPWILAQWNWVRAKASLDAAWAASGQEAASAAVEAQTLFKSVIEALEKDHPKELAERGLFGSLSYAYDAQAGGLDAADPMGKSLRCEALWCAQRAVAMNPLRSWERAVLAYSYFQVEDSERARQEWSTAQDLAPEDLGTLSQLAQTCTKRAYGFRDRKKRRELLEAAAGFLEELLPVAESQSPSPNSADAANPLRNETIALIRFKLGWTYRDLLDYDLAISHLIKAKALNFKPLELNWTIGFFSVEHKAYNQADNYIEQGIQALGRLKDDKKVAFDSKSPLAGEEMPMARLLAKLYLLRAQAHAERGVKRSEAEGDIRRARELLAWQPDGKSGSDADDEARRLEAHYHHVRGVIALQWGPVTDAIAEFERALDSGAYADTYFGLAKAYCAYAGEQKRNGTEARNSQGDRDVPPRRDLRFHRLLPEGTDRTTGPHRGFVENQRNCMSLLSVRRDHYPQFGGNSLLDKPFANAILVYIS